MTSGAYIIPIRAAFSIRPDPENVVASTGPTPPHPRSPISYTSLFLVLLPPPLHTPISISRNHCPPEGPPSYAPPCTPGSRTILPLLPPSTPVPPLTFDSTPPTKTPFVRCPEVLPDDATDLVKRLMRRNPARRLGAGPLLPLTGGATARPATDNGSVEAVGGDAKKGRGGGRRDGAEGGGGGGGGGFDALKAHPFFHGLEFVGDGQVGGG